MLLPIKLVSLPLTPPRQAHPSCQIRLNSIRLVISHQFNSPFKMTECHILPFYTAKNGRADELPALDLNSHEMVFRGTLLVRTELKAINAYINGEQMVSVVLWRPKFAQSVLEKELEVIDEHTAMVDTKCKKTGTRCKDLRELFGTKRK